MESQLSWSLDPLDVFDKFYKWRGGKKKDWIIFEGLVKSYKLYT